MAVTDPGSLPERLIAAVGAGGLLLIIGLAYPRGMGMGDVKLAAVMGLYLGSAVAPALFVGVLSGAVVGLALMAARGSGARKLAVPFGPFLALGGVVALLAGDQLIDCVPERLRPLAASHQSWVWRNRALRPMGEETQDASSECSPTKKKTTSLVGLDIESGSIAATEVQSQDDRTVGRTAIVPLEPGVVREGDVRERRHPLATPSRTCSGATGWASASASASRISESSCARSSFR